MTQHSTLFFITAHVHCCSLLNSSTCQSQTNFNITIEIFCESYCNVTKNIDIQCLVQDITSVIKEEVMLDETEEVQQQIQAVNCIAVK